MRLRCLRLRLRWFAPEVKFGGKYAPEARANLKPGAMISKCSEMNRQAIATRIEQLGKVCDALVEGEGEVREDEVQREPDR